jgi:hypothetical protein
MPPSISPGRLHRGLVVVIVGIVLFSSSLTGAGLASDSVHTDQPPTPPAPSSSQAPPESPRANTTGATPSDSNTSTQATRGALGRPAASEIKYFVDTI